MKNLFKASSLALILLTTLTLYGQQGGTTTVPDRTLKVFSGFNYIEGSFGLATDTEVITVPAGVSYEIQDWTFQLDTSYISIDGPAVVLGGGASGAGTIIRPVTSRESGMGDTYLRATYRFDEVLNNTIINLQGRVKFPTADEDRGLGSGEMDYYIQTDVYHTIGVVTFIGNVGYRFLGSNSAYLLQDGFYLAGGATTRVSDRFSVGGLLTWGEAFSVGGEDTSELIGFLSYKINERWDTQVYALTGFTDASPDFGIGLRLNLKL